MIFNLRKGQLTLPIIILNSVVYLNNLDIAQQNLNSTYDTHHITTKTERAQKNSKKKTSTLKGNYVDLVTKNYQKF